MARSIVTAASIASAPRTRAAPGSSSSPVPVADDYSDALLKLIPAEVIGLYLSIHAIASSQTDISRIPFGVIFMIGMVVTVFYLKVYLKVSSTRQVAISAGAFFFWALAINSSSEHSFLGIHGYWAGICVLLYTFVVPKIPLDSRPDGENS